jgi:hypothetical protein
MDRNGRKITPETTIVAAFAVAKSSVLAVICPSRIRGDPVRQKDRAFSLGGHMVLGLFENATQRRRDEDELKAMHRRYGGEIISVLEARTQDGNLSDRDRKHWGRLLRKARSRFAD